MKKSGFCLLAVLMLPFLGHCAGPLAGAAAMAEELDPAFRLPIGGRALAGPLVDSAHGSTAVWVLSEDKHLYLLSETGKLLAHPAPEGKLLPFLCLDASGRALVCCETAPQGAAVPGGSTKPAGFMLTAYTRTGTPAFRSALAEKPEQEAVPGADGRLFIPCRDELVCLAANGRRLWATALTSAPSAPPCVDGIGRIALGLQDGRLLFFSPYGELLAETRPGRISCMAALSPAGAAADMGAAVLAAGLESGRIVFIDSEGRAGAGGDCGKSAVVALELCPRADGAGLESLVALCAEGKLSAYALPPSGGASAGTELAAAVLWQADTGFAGGSGSRARLYVFQHRLIVTIKGGAKSYSTEGELRAEASFKNSTGASAPSPQGLLFSPGEDWIVGAYRFVPALGPILLPHPARFVTQSQDEFVASTLLFDPEIGNPGHQLALIQDIETKLASGSLGSGEDRAALLSAAIARGRFQPVSPDAGWKLRDNPLARTKAASILGDIGSPDSIDDLLAVLNSDADISIKAAAARSLGEIGLDPDNKVGAVFEKLIGKYGGNLGDELALALIEAIESIASRAGGPPDLGLVRALISLSSSGYSAAVRSRAAKAVSTLSGGAF